MALPQKLLGERHRWTEFHWGHPISWLFERELFQETETTEISDSACISPKSRGSLPILSRDPSTKPQESQ